MKRNLRIQNSAYSQFALEKSMAEKLSSAGKTERAKLYPLLYEEFFCIYPKLKDQHRDYVEHQVSFVDAFVRPDTRFLEIGAGDCSLSTRIAKKLSAAYATDVSSTRVDGLGNFRFVQADGSNIPLPAESIDIAYSNQLLEHLHPEDAADHLREVHRLLCPGGIYICVTPNKLCGPHDISKYFGDVPRGLHLKEYSVSDMIQVFQTAGFGRIDAVLSYRGRILSPRLPAVCFVPLEAVLSHLPPVLRKPLSWGLNSIKTVAVK